MKRNVFALLLAGLLVAACAKDDTATRLAAIYDRGAKEVAAAKDADDLEAATRDVLTERDKLKGDVSAADYEQAAHAAKVESAARRYTTACAAKALSLGGRALKDALKDNDVDVARLANQAATLLQDSDSTLDVAVKEFEDALEAAARAFSGGRDTTVAR